MPIGILTLHLYLTYPRSLKAKRGIIKPIISRLHREFNISVAEFEKQDSWKEAIILCAIISNDRSYNEMVLNKVIDFVKMKFPDTQLSDHTIEIL